VQKYGGSSVADADRIKAVARRICRAHDGGSQVVAVVSAMGDTTDELIALAHEVSERPEPRELDMLLSTGELVSCTLIAMALRTMEYEAISLSGAQAGIRTDGAYGKARIAAVEPGRVRRELDAGNIVVVAGFQGVTGTEDVTTLGRGASDLSAVAIAAALGADRCEVYTDVEGIYTADPRLVPDARKLDEIGFEEMLELASYGAKMHPRSVELGAVYQIPIYVASSFSDATGTLIHRLPDGSPMENRIKVTGIALNANVAKITVRSVPDRPGIAAALFEPLSKVGISVDTIVQNTSVDRTTDISFTVSRADLARAEAAVGLMMKNLGGSAVVTDATLATVSIVGSGMQNTPGYASRMFRVLADGDINIDMITTSEIRISCIIKEEQAQLAVRLLHQDFQLEDGTDEGL
jgi:aspartate kinase